MAGLGAVVGGRWTYEAAEHWGDENPWGLPFFIVTHRPEEQPDGDSFVFVDGVEEAVALAKDAAGEKDVSVMGGADTIRQALEAGLVDQLTLIVAPVILGGGSASSRASRRTWTSSTAAFGSRNMRRSSTTGWCAREGGGGGSRGRSRVTGESRRSGTSAPTRGGRARGLRTALAHVSSRQLGLPWSPLPDDLRA